ncbi:DNA-binding protein StpA [compost metagenome]
MSDLLKTLNNIRTLRAQAREIDLTTLEEMLEKLTAIVADRREEEATSTKEQQEKQAKIEAFRQKLLEEGIDPAELLSSLSTSASTKVKSARAPRPAKYKYVDVDGSKKTWTGQGRTPKAIAEAIANGRSLGEFEI